MGVKVEYTPAVNVVAEADSRFEVEEAVTVRLIEAASAFRYPRMRSTVNVGFLNLAGRTEPMRMVRALT